MNNILRISGALTLVGATVFGINRGVTSLKHKAEAALGKITEDVLTSAGKTAINKVAESAIPVVADEVALNLFIPGFDKEVMELRREIRKERNLKLASK